MQASQYFTRSVDVETLFSAADVDGDGVVGLDDATSFFAGALLPTASMNAIWAACATSVSLPVGPGRSCTAITRSTFMNVLLLISASQQNVSPLTPAVALAAAPLPPPAFIALSHADCARYEGMFATLGKQRAPPNDCGKLFSIFTAGPVTLNSVWALADRDHDNMLSLPEFLIAMALLAHASRGMPLPTTVPATVLCSIPGMHSLQRTPAATVTATTTTAAPTTTSPSMSMSMQPQQTQMSPIRMPPMQAQQTQMSSQMQQQSSMPTMMSVSPMVGTTMSPLGATAAPLSPRGTTTTGGDIADLERQLREARMKTAQLRASQNAATARNSELVLQRAEAEETLRSLQNELQTLTQAAQADESAAQQAMGVVRDASTNMTAAQAVQQHLQEEQNKQIERVQTARMRIEQLSMEATELREELKRINAETDSLKQQLEVKKARETALGDLADLFKKQMEGNNINADTFLSFEEN